MDSRLDYIIQNEGYVLLVTSVIAISSVKKFETLLLIAVILSGLAASAVHRKDERRCCNCPREI